MNLRARIKRSSPSPFNLETKGIPLNMTDPTALIRQRSWRSDERCFFVSRSPDDHNGVYRYQCEGEQIVASPFVIMTGASGVGKTTIARTIRQLHPEISVFLDEELERPTERFMESIGPTEGPGGPFQRGFALYSIPRIAKARERGKPILLDCQCRLAFIREAIATVRVTDVRPVLVECDDPTRDARLHGRGSPELANEQMRSWSKYLHSEAVDAGLDILDTGANTLDENIAHILSYLEK